ncbi:hypothetical protein [Marinobacter sp. F4218]|uniref:hypothetical protein n=1 Tax=Marinobacter sp. F4218 TaxID=2862868 RepID=UPI001C63292D|nr:hypothetical protein [Marinobacter sp. F4218]MBW7469479.1 hypothetical protein [Marinobacter sp. F4218]
MRQLFYIVLLSFPSISAALDFEQAEKLLKKQWIEGDPEVAAYSEERMQYENSIRLDERGGCYGIRGDGITQILRINEEGVVDQVVSSSKGPKSECFRELYLGTKFKKPPKAPIYRKMMMGYSSS